MFGRKPPEVNMIRTYDGPHRDDEINIVSIYLFNQPFATYFRPEHPVWFAVGWLASFWCPRTRRVL